MKNGSYGQFTNHIQVGTLNKRIEVWGKAPFKNELGENDFENGKIKTIWASIVPQTGVLQKGQVETILSDVTTKIIVRYNSGKDITQDMWLIYHKSSDSSDKGRRFDIKYILNPYEGNESLEIFCSEVIGN